MPTINVIPNWTIKKLTDNQVLVGTLQANGVYKMKYTRDGYPKEECFSIKDVKPITAPTEDPEAEGEIVDYEITPSIVFWDDGFESFENLDKSYIVKASEVTEIERMYIRYDAVDRSKRPKSVDEDPFVFNFINPKSNKPFRIVVDHDHFVGIPALTKRGDVHTNFGFIDHVETDDTGAVTKVVMNSIISNRGVFRASTTVIPYSKLRGIYHYEISIIPHKIAFKSENKIEEKAEEADIGCTPWGPDDVPATESAM